jgi:serine/threonine protein kinase
LVEEMAKTAASPRIDLGSLRVEKRIGTGTQGVVWLGFDPKTGTRCALKQLKKGRLAARIKPGSVIKRPHKLSWMVEKEALRVCGSHPFVTTLFAAFQDADNLYLALELGSSGDLFSLLHAKEEGRIPEPEARFYTGCVGLALAHVHAMGFLYCDVKLENVVLAPNGYPRLCDFGLVHCLDGVANAQTSTHAPTPVLTADACKPNKAQKGSLRGILQSGSEAFWAWATHDLTQDFIDNKPSPPTEERVMRKCGTDQYQPPEVVEGLGRTRAADMWALGVLLHELLAGRSPFDDGSLDTGKADIYERIASYASGGRKAQVDLMAELIHEDEVSLSEQGGDMLLGLLSPAEGSRLGCGPDGFGEIETHPWFNDFDWVQIARQQLPAPHIPHIVSSTPAVEGGTPGVATSKSAAVDDHAMALKEMDQFVAAQCERDAPYDDDLWNSAFGTFGPTVAN